MTRRRSHGLEAFSGEQLAEYIEREHDGRLIATRGSHLTYQLPDGRKVGTLDKGYIPSVMARSVAQALGMPYTELRAAMDHPVNRRRGGGPKHKVERFTPTPVSRDDVLVALDYLTNDVAGLAPLRCGQRDAAFYAAVLPCLNRARAELAKLPQPLSTWAPAEVAS